MPYGWVCPHAKCRVCHNLTIFTTYKLFALYNPYAHGPLIACYSLLTKMHPAWTIYFSYEWLQRYTHLPGWSFCLCEPERLAVGGFEALLSTILDFYFIRDATDRFGAAWCDQGHMVFLQQSPCVLSEDHSRVLSGK